MQPEPVDQKAGIDFFSLLPSQLAERIGGSGRAKEVWALLRQNKNPQTSECLSVRLRNLLADRFQLAPATLDAKQTASDGTRKLRVKLADGSLIETVVIPGQRRNTVCISTQVGCARACRFCATGQMGLTRHLSAGEIVYQINLAQQELKTESLAPVDNVVLMGMGEPLDNFEAVQQALAVICHPHGWRLPPRRITLSTIGPSPETIERLNDLNCNLAWSLHSADDQVRRQLIPATRHHNVDLRNAFVKVLQNRHALLFVEMIMFNKINDRPSDIDLLMEFWAACKERVRVNILPFNQVLKPTATNLAPSPPQRLAAIRKQLQNAGFFCEIRRPRGLDIQAACGQLASTSRNLDEA
jgi:23S rRNA (adenine2503-C2)-methyltransferase